VLGHSDVAPARKDDPGELFPWPRLADAGVGVFPLPLRGGRRPGAQPSAPRGGQGEGDLAADALAQYGYDPNAPKDKVIAAFQRHFRPSRIDGIWDKECAALLSALLG
jgi:N-acetyl-anhydromuramyl-L-alanine amidase AmpD